MMTGGKTKLTSQPPPEPKPGLHPHPRGAVSPTILFHSGILFVSDSAMNGYRYWRCYYLTPRSENDPGIDNLEGVVFEQGAGDT